MQKQINVRKLLLQNAISGELNAKLTEWKELREEISQIANEFEAMTENELFLENEYYRLTMENLEKTFYQKQQEFNTKSGLLRAIFVHPVYVN